MHPFHSTRSHPPPPPPPPLSSAPHHHQNHHHHHHHHYLSRFQQQQQLQWRQRRASCNASSSSSSSSFSCPRRLPGLKRQRIRGRRCAAVQSGGRRHDKSVGGSADAATPRRRRRNSGSEDRDGSARTARNSHRRPAVTPDDERGNILSLGKRGSDAVVTYVETQGRAAVQLGSKYMTDPVVGVAALLGAALAVGVQNLYRELVYRFMLMRRTKEHSDQYPSSYYQSYYSFASSSSYYGSAAAAAAAAAAVSGTEGLVVFEGDRTESVEWVNSFLRKIWRVYQLNLERWFRRLLSPVINKGATNKRPNLIRSLTVEKFTLDHEPPLFYNMSRRTSRKDSDLNCVVDVRYTGGARMLMLLETAFVRLKIPVEVTDFDVDAQMWLKVRMAPLVPYVGTISAAFVGEPNIRVELSPYSRVPLMRMPIIQDFLTKLLTKDLPRLMVLPERLEINIPPALTAVAEAAIGRDAVATAVATAVVTSDAAPFWFNQLTGLKQQTAAGGISLPDTYTGELTVLIREARYLRVGGVRGLLDVSDPYCVCVLGTQSVESRRSKSTGDMSYRQGNPVWNQEFQFLVEDKNTQMINVFIKDSKLTFKTELGQQRVALEDLEDGRAVARWVRLVPPGGGDGSGGNDVDGARSGQGFSRRFLPRRRDPEVLLELTYKAFEDDDLLDSGFREAMKERARDPHVKSSEKEIVDIRSAVKATRVAAAMSAQSAARVAAAKAYIAKDAALKAASKLGPKSTPGRADRADPSPVDVAGPGGAGAQAGADGRGPEGGPGEASAAIFSEFDVEIVDEDEDVV